MFESELIFLCDIFKKSHIDTSVIKSAELKNSIEERLGEFLTGKSDANVKIKFTSQLPIAYKTVYKLTDPLGFSYIYFRLSDDKASNVLLIGPYMYERISENKMLEYAEKYSLTAKYSRYLVEYYKGVSVVPKEGLLFTMISSFCERLWNTTSFAIIDINDEYLSPVSPIGNSPKEENFDEILADMKTMEKRYDYENELIEAVRLGQMHKENLFASSFSDNMFEKRVADPLRNAKNYCIIMNTLLRKAAESGGVHPVYIDRVSSGFALKIEELSFTSDTVHLMREIFKTYCKLVQNHTMMGLSELVKNTILLIDSDISASISPSSIAKTHNISPGYLSALFKKETGKTLTEYIKNKRISHAKHLLKTSQLQIQTVASHCGIVDIQYFSKIFKRETGKTPKQYRESFVKK